MKLWSWTLNIDTGQIVLLHDRLPTATLVSGTNGKRCRDCRNDKTLAWGMVNALNAHEERKREQEYRYNCQCGDARHMRVWTVRDGETLEGYDTRWLCVDGERVADLGGPEHPTLDFASFILDACNTAEQREERQGNDPRDATSWGEGAVMSAADVTQDVSVTVGGSCPVCGPRPHEHVVGLTGRPCAEDYCAGYWDNIAWSEKHKAHVDNT